VIISRILNNVPANHAFFHSSPLTTFLSTR
jgi:hypothetical protein